MKTILTKIVLIILLISSVSFVHGINETGVVHDSKHKSHRLLSCNIRVALPQDSVKGVGWDKRKDLCIEIIKKQNADIICAQEVLKIQYEDLLHSLSDYYAFGFEGPDMDAFPVGYHGIAKNVIFYSKKRYELIAQGNYWLSETPHIAGSISWGSARARHCNWVRLFDKYTGKTFRVIDTHLDHISQSAKEAQVKMILEETKQYQEIFPQLLFGDFNANVNNRVITTLINEGWVDLFAKLNIGNENKNSYHGFRGLHNDSGDSGRIDFIFSYGPIDVLASKLITDHVDGMFPSDHFFLFAEVEIK